MIPTQEFLTWLYTEKPKYTVASARLDSILAELRIQTDASPCREFLEAADGDFGSLERMMKETSND